MRRIACLPAVLLYALTGTFAWAGCADLNNVTNWSDINTHKIIMYRNSKAIAVLDIPNCTIYKTSEIRLIKDYVCNLDKIIVSGQICDVRSVERL